MSHGHNKNNNLARACTVSAFALSTLALGMALYPVASTSADSTGTEVSTTISEFLKLAVDTDSLVMKDSNNNTAITPSASGTLITGDVNVAVTTNTAEGYTLSIYTADDTTSMTHNNSTTNAAISSISSATGYDAATGLADLATNTWGFRRNTGTAGSPAYGNWFGVGVDGTHAVVIDETDEPNDSYCDSLAYPLNESGCANGSYDEYALNFGANPTSALPAGTYINNVVISAVAKSEGQKYSVTFNSNGGSNTMGTRTIVAGSTFTMPSSSNVVKEGYTIAGYAFTSDAASAAYTPGQIVTVNDFLSAAETAGQTPASGITLYIIWEEKDVAYMQTFSCSDLAEGASTTLVDTRDSSAYTVKKFGTGTNAECWMTSNLKLGHDSSYTLTSADTNIPDSTTYYLPQAGYRGDVASSSTLTSIDIAEFGDHYASEANVQYRASGTTDNDTGDPVPEDTGYYNYSAASLGYSYYNGGASSGETPRDICPKGWQLPRGADASTHSFYWLDTVVFGGDGSNRDNDPTIRDKYLNQASFGYAGSYISGALRYVGSDGTWWSSTIKDSNYAYSLYLDIDGYMYPHDDNNKANGVPVRCVTQ